jgi:hypothetical protein
MCTACLQVIVGKVRVSALSSTLVRVEPQGPKGFEDRTTFMVENRTAFPGIPLTLVEQNSSVALLSTTSYQIVLFQASPNSKESVSMPLSFLVTTPTGELLYNSTADASTPVQCAQLQRASCSTPCFWDKDSGRCLNLQRARNLLHWPSPLEERAYALVDYPRFFVPQWGPTPIPEDAKVDPELRGTNGYDFTNNVEGDVYVFLLGDTIDSWAQSRSEFLQLSGPVPLLPDYAFGIWFTRWHQYTEDEAKGEIEQWEKDELPLDIWGLDMNWRNTSEHQVEDRACAAA